MSEPAFDTLGAARRLKAAGIASDQAEAIVEVMGQSVNQLVTRTHFDAVIAKLRAELDGRIGGVRANLQSLDAKVQSLEAKVLSLEATMRTEIMRAVLIVLGVLIPVIGLMMAGVEFYSARSGGA